MSLLKLQRRDGLFQNHQVSNVSSFAKSLLECPHPLQVKCECSIRACFFAGISQNVQFSETANTAQSAKKCNYKILQIQKCLSKLNQIKASWPMRKKSRDARMRGRPLRKAIKAIKADPDVWLPSSAASRPG